VGLEMLSKFAFLSENGFWIFVSEREVWKALKNINKNREITNEIQVIFGICLSATRLILSYSELKSKD
jgi:hypothetical protein